VSNKLLLGLWRFTFRLPHHIWQGHIAGDAGRTAARLGFMTAEHHLVRDFAVRELPRLGKPLSAGLIAQALSLPVARVQDILDELEREKTFLFRNAEGAVTWAYPVTVDETPHRVTFSTGEQIYAA
jgi:hypothetical protein